MCGIFALLNYEQKYTPEFVKQQFEQGRGRGPDHSTFQKMDRKISFGFHRLAINGLNAESNQPLVKGDLTLICNGEIYNYKDLYALMGVRPATQSDCEVILWLYERYGIEHTLQMLDGVFAFALLDQRCQIGESVLYVARDPYGVRPLYTMYHPAPAPHPYLSSNETTIGFASELKMLSGFGADMNRVEYAHFTNANVEYGHFSPGTYSKYIFSDKVCSEWSPAKLNQSYHRTAFSTLNGLNSRSEIIRGIQSHLIRAVEKRCFNTERPIACLLSGGLDSSLIAALVSEHHKREGKPPVETYSIGLADSTDLKYARQVADHLGTKHTEIVLTEREFCEAIPRVIEAIESYDTTTVRASIGNFLLGEYIAKHSQAKVIFNGDGSDELMGGYLYMKSAPDAIEFDRECRRLLRDVHAFDVLRSDKCISSHGLEPRTPFLDREWTQFYLSISPLTRWRPFCSTLAYPADRIEKHLLRLAFSKEHYQPDSELRNKYLLPDDVLWRRKEAFSDGVSGEARSLYQIIQEYVIRVGALSVKNISVNTPQTAEQMHYRSIFERAYPGAGNVVPYFWMPKYVEAKDASARTLSIYQSADK